MEGRDRLKMKKITPEETLMITDIGKTVTKYVKNRTSYAIYKFKSKYFSLHCSFDNGMSIVVENSTKRKWNFFDTWVEFPPDHQVIKFTQGLTCLRPKRQFINGVEYSYPTYCDYSQNEEITADDDRGVRICEGNPNVLWHYYLTNGQDLYYRSGFLLRSKLVVEHHEYDFEMGPMPEFKQEEDLVAEDYEELVKRLYLPEIPALKPKHS